MAERNFYWKDSIDKARWERSCFQSDVLLANQAIYDLSDSVPKPDDTVKRHESLETPCARYEFGVKVALVYLVSRLECKLHEWFENLWRLRRDMLHEWIKNNFSGSSQGPGKGPTLTVNIEDIWAPRVRHMSVERYFEATILDRWRSKGIKEKLKVLGALMKPPLEGRLTESVEEAIAVRNDFVHPHPSRGSVGQEREQDPLPIISQVWYERVTGALLDLVETAGERLGEATTKQIATNMRGLRDLLSDRQSVRYGTYLRGTGDTYEDLEGLLRVVKEHEGEKRLRAEIVVLGLTAEVAQKIRLLESFHREHPEIPVIIYEGVWEKGLRKGDMEMAEKFCQSSKHLRFVPSHRYPGGTWDESYKAEVALQEAIKEFKGI